MSARRTAGQKRAHGMQTRHSLEPSIPAPQRARRSLGPSVSGENLDVSSSQENIDARAAQQNSAENPHPSSINNDAQVSNNAPVSVAPVIVAPQSELNMTVKEEPVDELPAPPTVSQENIDARAAQQNSAENPHPSPTNNDAQVNNAPVIVAPPSALNIQIKEEPDDELMPAPPSMNGDNNGADVRTGQAVKNDEEDEITLMMEVEGSQEGSASASYKYFALGLGEPLFEGTDVTVGQAHLGLNFGCMKFNWSKANLSYIIDHINLLLPLKNSHPKTLLEHLKIEQKLSHKAKDPEAVKVCNGCANWVPNFASVCVKCESKLVDVHIQNDLCGIIKDMFENHNLAKAMDDFCKENELRRQRPGPSEVTDVCDGTTYLNFEKQQYDICLMQNSNVIPVPGRANAQIWSNFLTILDVPNLLRKRFNFLAELRFVHEKPDMNTFFDEFVKFMVTLATQGVDWKHPITKMQMNSKVYLIMSVSDAKARAQMQNLNSATDIFGCSFCEISDLNIYLGVNSHELRCNTNMINYALQLRNNNKNTKLANKMRRSGMSRSQNVRGVKGFSSLADLPHFDIGTSFTTEYVETCLLGVVKSHLLLILSPENKEKLFYVDESGQKSISKFLIKVKIPSFVSQRPRDLATVKYWKAAELRDWLLYYSLPCLEIVWKNNKFIQHYASLVFVIHTLLKSELKDYDMREAENAIKQFSEQFELLYGKTEMSYNLHVVQHLAQAVEKFGPLFGHSAFLFEKENEILNERIRGAADIVTELVNTTKVLNSFRGLQLACQQPEQPGNFRFSPNHIVQDVPLAISNFLIDQLPHSRSQYLYYSRVNFKGFDISTESSIHETDGSSSHYFAFEDCNGVLKAAKGLYFSINDDMKVFVGKRVNLLEPRFKYEKVTVKHILNCEDTDDLVFGFLSTIRAPLMSINVPQNEDKLKVLCVPPNLIE